VLTLERGFGFCQHEAEELRKPYQVARGAVRLQLMTYAWAALGLGTWRPVLRSCSGYRSEQPLPASARDIPWRPFTGIKP
jgi:hypothetical protein